MALYYAVQVGYLVSLTIQNQAILAFKSVDNTLQCDLSNESYSEVLTCGSVYLQMGGYV